MKKIGILILALFYCYSFAFSQANNDSIKYPIDISIDTSIIYDDARDYVIKVKVEQKCICSYDIEYFYIGPAASTYICMDSSGTLQGTPVRFLKIKIIDRLYDFTSDSISDSLLFSIKYLMIPKDIILSPDSIYNILVDRQYSYDYLVFVKTVNENTKFAHENWQWAPPSGLQPTRYETPKLILWLYNNKLLHYKIGSLFRVKHRNQKNIEQCLREIKKRK